MGTSTGEGQSLPDREASRAKTLAMLTRCMAGGQRAGDLATPIDCSPANSDQCAPGDQQTLPEPMTGNGERQPETTTEGLDAPSTSPGYYWG